MSMTSVELEHRRSLNRWLVRDPELDADMADELWSNADGLMASSETLKDKAGDRCTVVLAARGGRQYVLKRYNLRGRWHTARHLPLRSRAKWCWMNGHRLRAAGLLTPRPLAVFEERCGPLTTRSFLVTEFIEGPTLMDEIRSRRASGPRLERFAEQFGRIWRTLGEHRIGHRDMKATNFIVDRDDQLWMVDLDGMRVHHLATSFARRRAKDRARFLRNWQSLPEVGAVFLAHVGTAAPPA
ncbi:MAG: lipopolysaccharide kinase InaA family protein [Planctomycetota bacterium]|jgi:hypothetical protein